MSERYRPKKIMRERERNLKTLVEAHDPKPKVLVGLCCRLHGEPWMSCTKCSTTKPR